jgi:GMP synthase PP-ATPase subunit
MRGGFCLGSIYQSFAVLLPVRSVDVMGDERTYDFTIANRPRLRLGFKTPNEAYY